MGGGSLVAVTWPTHATEMTLEHAETRGILLVFASLPGAQNKSLGFIKAGSKGAACFLACKHPRELTELRARHPACCNAGLVAPDGPRGKDKDGTSSRCGQGAVEDEAQESLAHVP